MSQNHDIFSVLNRPFHPVAQGALLACLGAGAWAQSAPAPITASPAATLEFVQGAVNVRSAEGSSRLAQRGTVVNNGETIETQSGRAQMRMVDGAFISLQNDTTLRLDNYRVASAAEPESGLMSLVRGGLRTVTGLIGRSNKQNYRLQTATATIGIRGTGYTATSGDDGTRVRVSEGQVALCTQGGCLDLAAQQSGLASSATTPPVRIALAPALQPTQAPSVMASAQQDQRPTDVANIVKEQTPPAVIPPAFPPRIPLTAANNSIDAAYSATGVRFTAGLLTGAVTFDAEGRMLEFVDSYNGFGLRATPANVSDFGSDGIIAWGRWNGGTTTYAGNPVGSITHLTYFAGNRGAAVPITGNFSVFGSTAPLLINPTNGGVLAMGASNSVTGNMSINFPGATGGSLSYNLLIPVAGQNFMVTGMAAQNGGTGFLGTGSSISSSGGACANGCAGATPYGDTIQGAVFGTGNTRVGAQYGFTTGLGAVTGTVVLRTAGAGL